MKFCHNKIQVRSETNAAECEHTKPKNTKEMTENCKTILNLR